MDTRAYSEIDDRLDVLRQELGECRLCPRRCGVNRLRGEKGFCKLDEKVRYFREIIFNGEEMELNPSHQIHFAGCNLRCEFCVVSEWNQQPWEAKEVDYDGLAKRIMERYENGAKTLNFLGGEPSANLHGILELLKRIEPEIKVVFNSNMYYNSIVEKLARGLVDVYLADFKCGNVECSKKLLGATDYIETVQRNIIEAAAHSDVIVRHVIMPGHVECCLKPILEWLRADLPGAKLSLRDNYVPPVESRYAAKEYLNGNELRSAVEMAESMGLNLIK